MLNTNGTDHLRAIDEKWLSLDVRKPNRCSNDEKIHTIISYV
jgi:hypothetical protein